MRKNQNWSLMVILVDQQELQYNLNIYSWKDTELAVIERCLL